MIAFRSIAALAICSPCDATPPLVTGDVPTADKEAFEVWLGLRYLEDGHIERQIPVLETVYGITDRWEASFELPYLSITDHSGPGDLETPW